MLKEAHTYHIDYPGLLATRDVLLGFGRRLAGEGLLDGVADVWLLAREELRAALTEPADLRSLVAARRADLAVGLVEGPKAYLGESPPERERHAALEKFYGSGGRALNGAGASPGVAEGVARLVVGTRRFRAGATRAMCWSRLRRHPRGRHSSDPSPRSSPTRAGS